MGPAARARQAAGLSIEEVAKRLQTVTPATIRRYESPSARVPFHIAEQLARVYGCKMEIFLQNASKSDARG